MDMKQISLGGLTLGAAIWVGAHWGVVGQEVGMRMGMGDELSPCRSAYTQWIKEDAEAQLAELKEPEPAYELQLSRQMRSSQFFQAAQEMSRYGLAPGQRNPIADLIGIDPFDVPAAAESVLEQKHRSARAAYDQAVSRIRAATDAKASKSADACEQAIASAVSEDRTSWAMFTGSLGLVKPIEVERFRDRIRAKLRSQLQG